MFDSKTLSGALQRAAGATVLALGLTAIASAQAEQPPSHDLRISFDSGAVANTGARRAVVISKTIHVDDADWMRLFFNSVQLAGNPEDATGSILRITSHFDGAVQELNARHVSEWQNSTAYFNGDTLQVEVEASPGTGDNRLVLGQVTASMLGGAKSQCGPTDDRVLSNDPRNARALPIGCTAWIFNDCKHCFGTAGHCSTSSLQVIQFNVPLSNPNGSLNNPPPQDQYAVEVASKQSTNGGIGNDWGYFGVFNNPNTGLTPFQAQGAAYDLTTTVPPFGAGQPIRITGYGVDSTPQTSNQVQQTHVGPWVSFSGSTLTYQVDTTGGNSGSPVLHENTGEVIGIHTNAGCTTGGGANSGTASNNGGFKNALASPKGGCLPVASTSTYCTAKSNNLACIPTIFGVGTPSASGGVGSFSINSSQQINKQNGLMIYGTLPATTPFSGGFLCVGGTVIRTPGQNSGGSPTGVDCTGNFTFDMGGLIAAGTSPHLYCGATVYSQYWTRDTTTLPPNNVNLSQGLKFEIGL